MKKRTKVMGLMLCAMLLVVGSVLGTLAYLTSEDSVTNSFSVGDVKIKVDEAKVNEAGQPLDEDGDVVTSVEDAERVEANDYHLIPGHAYVKDPTLTVLGGSEKSYVRMIVTITKASELDVIFARDGAKLTDIFTGYDSDTWKLVGQSKDETANTRTYEFRYKETVCALIQDGDGYEDVVLEPLFTALVVPGEITGDQLATIQGMTITVVGHAIQADGFAETTDDDGVTTSAEDNAWIAFGKQTYTP